MRPLIKIIAILIVIILVASSVYAVVSFGGNGGDNNNPGNKDDIPPTIENITGDTDGSPGKITSISVTFSDNEEVTVAMIYFKSMNANEWTGESILFGSYDIKIPDSDDDWYYYVTVDDAAGNGPVGKPSTDGSSYYTITITETVEELVHTVFIEEATGETCQFCPGVSELIHDFYKSGDYNLEYVSLVVQDDNAKKRLDEYNNIGQPTVYIDGGYKVLLGGGEKKEDVDAAPYIKALTTAEQRTVPELKVTVSIEYENNSDKFTTNVIIKNFEEETYTGTLKVYLAEIISRYNYKSGEPIYHGFLDFIIDEKISVDAGKEISKSEDWSLTGLDPENIIVTAVVFSSESVKKYSNPDSEIDSLKGPFDAYFADATDGTTLIEGGNLPPTVAISNPVHGKIHLRGKPLFKAPIGLIIGIFSPGFSITRLIGKTNFEVNAEDEDGIEKVEFHVDGELKFTDEEAPYEYEIIKLKTFKSIFFKKHTVKVIAYDTTGKTSEDEIEVRARW